MRARFTKVGAALAALVALAIGGSALASAAGSGSQQAKPPAVTQADDPAGKADTDSVQDENGKDDATEPADAPGSEAAESGSEVPGDDGPGGWADEPANPNADTQQEGVH
jgi:hypothetical protein